MHIRLNKMATIIFIVSVHVEFGLQCETRYVQCTKHIY
jgi:hypothetical protein